MNTDKDDPRAMADRIVEAGADPDEITAALAQLGDHAGVFLRRIAAHSAFRGVGEDPTEDVDRDAEASASLLVHVQSVYDAEKANTAALEHPKDLSKLPTWVAAKAAFGNDITFVIKLAGRHVTPPTSRFVRYAADALGVAITQVRQHFADGMPRGVAGAEFKSSGKPGTDGVEDFAKAVRAASIPDELRSRWLVE